MCGKHLLLRMHERHVKRLLTLRCTGKNLPHNSQGSGLCQKNARKQMDADECCKNLMGQNVYEVACWLNLHLAVVKANKLKQPPANFAKLIPVTTELKKKTPQCPQGARAKGIH